MGSCCQIGTHLEIELYCACANGLVRDINFKQTTWKQAMTSLPFGNRNKCFRGLSVNL